MKALQKLRQLVRGTLDRVVRHPNPPKSVFDGPEIHRLEYSRERGIQMEASFPQAYGLTAGLVKFFVESGGENYVELSVWHEKTGELTVTIQRRLGETPAQQAARWKRMYEELKSNTTAQGREAYPDAAGSQEDRP